MRITIIAFGKAGQCEEQALAERYLRRLSPPARFVELTRGPVPPAPPRSLTVALDERGEAWTSAELARRMAAWRDSGVRDLRFLIGPADGHEADTLAGADHRLALGPQTWPHLLVRAMLAEQLFRAQSLLAGHPYHRA